MCLYEEREREREFYFFLFISVKVELIFYEFSLKTYLDIVYQYLYQFISTLCNKDYMFLYAIS